MHTYIYMFVYQNISMRVGVSFIKFGEKKKKI